MRGHPEADSEMLWKFSLLTAYASFLIFACLLPFIFKTSGAACMRALLNA
jgi:hypothetical protein